MLELQEKDVEHLKFIYERMEHQHGENRQVDYMLRFAQIIDLLGGIVRGEPHLEDALAKLNKDVNQIQQNHDFRICSLTFMWTDRGSTISKYSMEVDSMNVDGVYNP